MKLKIIKGNPLNLGWRLAYSTEASGCVAIFKPWKRDSWNPLAFKLNF